MGHEVGSSHHAKNLRAPREIVEVLGDRFVNAFALEIKNPHMKMWAKRMLQVPANGEDVATMLKNLLLDPKNTIGRRNVFDLAQNLSHVNMLSKFMASFSLHEDINDVDCAMGYLGVDVLHHKHLILEGLETISRGSLLLTM